MNLLRPLFLPVVSALFLSFLTSCDRDQEIKVYKVAKESQTPAPAPKDPHAGVPMPTPGAADPHAGLGIAPVGGTPQQRVQGEVPETWTAGRGSSMRLASYLVRGDDDAVADISLIVLAGGAGGVLDNVNRWRGQLGLDPVDAEGLAATSSTVETPVGAGTVFDITSATPPDDPAKDGRIVAVIIPLAREMWFYKMRGNAALVEREKEGFLRWVATAKKTDTPDQQAPPATAPPATTPAPAATAPAPPPAGITWTVPDGWRAGPAKSMRVASFAVGEPGGPAGDVSLIRLAGDGGGDLANVNRWRGQIGLPPLTAETLAASVTTVESPAGTFSLVDCAGTEQRTLAAWIRKGSNSWFVKLTGPGAVVEAEQARFRQFLESLDFPAQ